MERTRSSRGKKKSRPRGMNWIPPANLGTNLIIIAFVIAILIVLVIFYCSYHEKHHHPDTSSKCKSTNQCMAGFEHGCACDYKPLQEGTECETSCYAPEEEEGETHYCTIQECDDCGEEPVCVGSTCAGACLLAADCPDLNNTFAPISNDCENFACVYSEVVSGLYNGISLECDPNSQVFKDLCLARLDPLQDIVLDNCLVATPECDSGNIVTCYYTFGCAPFEPLLIVK